MDEIWERAMDTALDGQTDIASVRTLTLDGAVKCFHGRLPPPPIFEKFHNLQHLSIANIGLSSLEQFPRLRNLQKLILSDNRIAGGLEFLVEAGLESLRDLDLSNNRISDIDVLRPLAELRLVSLDLYECPVTRVKDYRSLVFNMISSLKYLDKMDAEENERPESDDEEEDEEEEEEDPGSGEVDGDEHPLRVLSNGHLAGGGGVVDVDEDTESDADEEVAETSRGVSGLSKSGESHNHSNGFPENVVDGEDDEGEDDDSEDEIYEDDDEGDDEDVVEVHEIDDDSDDEEDGVEDDDEDEDEEVDNDERDIKEPESTGRLTSTEGEIDAHEQGEEDADEDDDGETGEDEQVVAVNGDFEDEEDEEEDNDNGYLVQPVGRVNPDAGRVQIDAGSIYIDPADEDEDLEMEEDEDDEDGEVQEVLPSSSSHKRKRDEETDSDDDDDDDDDDDNDDDGDEEDDDIVQ